MASFKKVTYDNMTKILREENIPTSPDLTYKWQIVWRSVFLLAILHCFSIYGLYLCVFKAKLATVIFGYVYTTLAGFGITAGAHRLWAHRTYKASFPLRLYLMLAQSAALQNNIYVWARDHRVHHKFTDTDADPHNSKRGFFFSHMGWLMVKKHKDVFEKGQTVDMSDLEADPLIRFQRKYYIPLYISLCFVTPALIPWYFWHEEGWVSFWVNMFRYSLSLHGTWLVNSAAHMYGMKPYDKNVNPRENRFVACVAYGEGWHNYHHTFPWDYKAAELGNYRWNFTTAFLDLMTRIGFATDLKTASAKMVGTRALRTGDGTWPKPHDQFNYSEVDQNNNQHQDKSHGYIWGWGDKDMDEEEKVEVKCYNKIK